MPFEVYCSESCDIKQDQPSLIGRVDSYALRQLYVDISVEAELKPLNQAVIQKQVLQLGQERQQQAMAVGWLPSKRWR